MKYATEVNVCLKDGRLVRVESRNGQKYLKDKPDQGEMKYSSGKIKCSLDRILKFKYPYNNTELNINISLGEKDTGPCFVCKNVTEKMCGGCKNFYYCSVSCQKLHWQTHKAKCKVLREKLSKDDSQEPKKECSKNYEIVTIPGKGMGIIAKHKINEGELIMKESPVFRFVSTDKAATKEDNVVDCFNYFLSLPKSQQDEICPYPSSNLKEKLDHFEKVFNTNAFDLSSYPPRNSYDEAIFKNISKINHSCIPNAERNFVDPELRIYAVRDIAKEEEICIEYYDLGAYDEPPTIKHVNEELMTSWKFDCKCELCGNDDVKTRKEIEKHRILYWKLLQKMDKKDMPPQMQADLCMAILTQMNHAKHWSPLDRANYGTMGFVAMMKVFAKLPQTPEEIKQAGRQTMEHGKRVVLLSDYFIKVQKDAYLITEGEDGPHSFLWNKYGNLIDNNLDGRVSGMC